MNQEIAVNSPSRFTRFLSLMSIATFWLLPFSPLVSWFALYGTRGSNDWSRKLAVAGTILCVMYAMLVIGWVGFLTFDTLMNVGNGLQ